VPSGDQLSIGAATAISVGVLLVGCSASMTNQIIEREYDGKMKRTRNRPLVRGTLAVRDVKIVGAAMAVSGLSCITAASYSLLAPGVPLVTILAGPALALANWFMYTIAYTSFKRITKFNTEFGAIVGAVPALIGWISFAAPQIGLVDALWSPIPWLLASLMYFWQMQHFMIIATRCREDYLAGGFCMRTTNTLQHGFKFGVVPLVLLFPGAWWFGIIDGVTAILVSLLNTGLVGFYAESLRNPIDQVLRRVQIFGYGHVILMFLVTFLFAVLENTTEKGSEFWKTILL